MSPPPTAEPRYRPDLEGLRGVAILLSSSSAMSGSRKVHGPGFVGVDVFFVRPRLPDHRPARGRARCTGMDLA